MANVLIIDDNPGMCTTLCQLVSKMECTGTAFNSIASGLDAARKQAYDIVFLDVNLPDGSGLDLLPRIQETGSAPEVIIITGYGDAHGAELAMNCGAWDYIEKSSSIQDIRLSLKRAIQYRLQKLAKRALVALKSNDIVGTSRVIQACLEKVAQAANSDVSVLITGETGTGKELFSRAIHENSARCGKSFVVLDCATLPESLVESTLFGHVKGAFTGADANRSGLIEQADGGTLFLDEIGELPLDLQKKFLRVLQERSYRPVGGKQEITSDFRLICATNRDLPAMVTEKQFRQDLLYRIQATHIHLPPLRERKEDIPALALAQIRRSCSIAAEASQGMSPEFIETLSGYDWPGNVRELMNTIERVLAEAFDEPILFPKHLPPRIRASVARKRMTHAEAPSAEPAGGARGGAARTSLKAFIEQMKEEYLRDLLRERGADIPGACHISGLSRSYLYQLLKKYNIDLPRLGSESQ
ncbi:MAG: sigma-54 dependent transcriptional regulator [Pseudomonadota bacterium]